MNPPIDPRYVHHVGEVEYRQALDWLLRGAFPAGKSPAAAARFARRWKEAEARLVARENDAGTDATDIGGGGAEGEPRIFLAGSELVPLERIEEVLSRMYDDPSAGGNAGADRFYERVSRTYAGISRQDVRRFVSHDETHQLHRRLVNRMRVVRPLPAPEEGPNVRWQMDLLDMGEDLRPDNLGHRYVLTIVDGGPRGREGLPAGLWFSLPPAEPRVHRTVESNAEADAVRAHDALLDARLGRRAAAARRQLQHVGPLLDGVRSLVPACLGRRRGYSESRQRMLARNERWLRRYGKRFEPLRVGDYVRVSMLVFADFRREVQMHFRGYIPQWTREVYRVASISRPRLGQPLYAVEDEAGIRLHVFRDLLLRLPSRTPRRTRRRCGPSSRASSTARRSARGPGAPEARGHPRRADPSCRCASPRRRGPGGGRASVCESTLCNRIEAVPEPPKVTQRGSCAISGPRAEGTEGPHPGAEMGLRNSPQSRRGEAAEGRGTTRLPAPRKPSEGDRAGEAPCRPAEGR